MSENIAKLMWNAYSIQAGGKTIDGKPLWTWNELGEDRQSCWIAAASVTADRIEKLEAALEALSHIHDGNPSYAYADVPELDYARHMLWEARQIARKALEGQDD